MDQVDDEQLAAGIVWLLRGIAVASVALPLALAEPPWSLASPVFGPLGALAVLVGIRRITAATPRSPWSGPVLGLAIVAVPLRLAAEFGQFGGPQPAAQAQLTTGSTVPGPWDVVALVAVGVTFIGVICLARHLWVVLVGIAGDRWRQVTFAWVAAAVAVPLSVATGALELVLLTAATIITAAALLLLSLLATYRAALDDELGREFGG